MARNVQSRSSASSSDDEKVTPPEQVEMIPEATHVITGEAQRATAVSDPPPPPKTYKVVKGGYILYDGCRSIMPEGKLVAETAYDIELLQKQGIVLELVE